MYEYLHNYSIIIFLQKISHYYTVCAITHYTTSRAGSPIVAKSRTLLLKSYLKSMKSLDFQSRKLVWKLVKSRKFTFPVMLKILVTLSSGN